MGGGGSLESYDNGILTRVVHYIEYCGIRKNSNFSLNNLWVVEGSLESYDNGTSNPSII